MPPDLNLRYVEHHFWKLDELAEAVGTTTDIVQALITARCAPGPIYVLGNFGDTILISSALLAGQKPPLTGQTAIVLS